MNAPEGWTVVPNEPTPEMLAVDFEQCCVSHHYGKFCTVNRRSMYMAMLAVARKEQSDERS